MQEWLSEQAATGFKAFAGTEITGSIHVSDALISEIVVKALAEAASRDGAHRTADTPVAALSKLVRRAAVRAIEGVVIVDLEIRV